MFQQIAEVLYVKTKVNWTQQTASVNVQDHTLEADVNKVSFQEMLPLLK